MTDETERDADIAAIVSECETTDDCERLRIPVQILNAFVEDILAPDEDGAPPTFEDEQRAGWVIDYSLELSARLHERKAEIEEGD